LSRNPTRRVSPSMGRPTATRVPLNTASARTSHSAAARMARDPEMPLTDVQWVLGHARLSTTQLYLNPLPEDVIASVAAFHARRERPAPPGVPAGAGGYRPESLKILFGDGL